MSRRVQRIDLSSREDFFRLHCAANGLGWCRCVAWWLPTWEGWGERGASENRDLREELFDRGEFDGYLLFEDDLPRGWCQVGARDRLEKLRTTMGLEVAPGTWAVTCMAVAKGARRSGVATALLSEVLADLADRGVERVEAYPRLGAHLDPGELWTGPEALYRRFGFEFVREVPPRAVLARTL